MRSLHQRVRVPNRALVSVALTLTAILAFVVFIAGCGGSSGGASSTQALLKSPPPISSSNAGGIWNGTVSNDLTGQSFEISGVVTEDNVEGRFLINGETLFVLRDISGVGGEITATISVSTRPDSQFLPERFPASGVMTGALVERTRIQGEWSLDTGDVGTVTLEYDDVYERGSEIERLAGIWKASSGTIYNIDALGEIFAQTEIGCVYSGQVELIDAAYNVYRVRIFDGCLVYEVSGLGVLGDDVHTDDTFVLMLGEGWFIADTLQRQ